MTKITEPKQIANQFNEYCSSIGKLLSNKSFDIESKHPDNSFAGTLFLVPVFDYEVYECINEYTSKSEEIMIEIIKRKYQSSFCGLI